MPSAQTWWWIGIGTGVTALATTGTVLIVRGRRRRAPLPPDLGLPPPRPVKPAKRKPKEGIFIPIEPHLQERSKTRSGSVVADDDPTLGYTDHFFSLYKLPADEGEFEVGVCVGLRHSLDKLTWNSILTPSDDGGEERLFLLQDLNLKAALTFRGRWEGDRIVDLEADEASLLCPGYTLRFPEAGSYFDTTSGTYPSWGGSLARRPLPGEKWGNGHLPRFGVKIEDGRLMLRIQVAPMVKAQWGVVTGGPLPAAKRNVKIYTSHKATYHYEYTAKIEYLKGIL